MLTIVTTDTDEFIPTRRSLLSRLKDWEDQVSWQDFFDTYGRLIYRVARQAGCNDAEAQDVVQETVLTVAKQMPNFHYDPAIGSFKSWLLQITRSRVNDAWRKKFYQQNGRRFPKEEDIQPSIIEANPAMATFDWDQVWQEEWEQNLTQAAIGHVRQHADPRQYQAFYLHVVKNTPARKVARRLSVNLAEVYYAKYKISGMIKKEIAALEKRGY
jgi:RNA polymerase sigma factor (sigma-70 family)